LADKARFRINIFSQRGHYSIVLRKLNTVIPTLDWLNFPDLPEPVAPVTSTNPVFSNGHLLDKFQENSANPASESPCSASAATIE